MRRYNRSPKARATAKRYRSTPNGQIMRYLWDSKPAARLRRLLNYQETTQHG